MPSHDPFEIHAEMRAFAERSFERAKFALDKFMETAQSAMNTFEGQSKLAQVGAKNARKKIMTFAEQNAATAFDYAQKLVWVKDPQALLALHSEFISSQMRVFSEQATTLYDIANKVAAE
jgi:phasin